MNERSIVGWNVVWTCASNKKVVRHKTKRIQIKKHKTETYKINKISLACFDDKRFFLDNGIHTLAYFHKDLKNTFPQMITNKKRWSQIRRDDHK